MKTTEREKSAAKTSGLRDDPAKENSMNGDESKSGKAKAGGYGKFALMVTVSLYIMNALMFLNV